MHLIKHLLTRHYDPSRYKNHIVDTENNILSVYLTNLSGQFVGFQQYNPLADKKVNNGKEGRYWTYLPRKCIGVWGLETLDRNKKDLYIVEGVFKCSALHSIGLNALAVLSCHPKHMKSWLHSLPFNLIGIGDNDEAGSGIIRVAGKGFKLDKDVDEYDLEELEYLIQEMRKELK